MLHNWGFPNRAQDVACAHLLPHRRPGHELPYALSVEPGGFDTARDSVARCLADAVERSLYSVVYGAYQAGA